METRGLVSRFPSRYRHLEFLIHFLISPIFKTPSWIWKTIDSIVLETIAYCLSRLLIGYCPYKRGIVVTQKQVGNGIGSIIASIGIPMILDAIRGKGVGRGGSRIGKGGPRIGPPPFIGTWSSGRGKKEKDRRARSTTRKNSPFKGIPLVGDIL